MKLIDKYIFKQVFLATFVGVLLFIVIWISPEILFRIIRQVTYGEITADIAVQLFFLEIPEILGKGIPVGLLLGSLFVFDRLSRDFELITIRSIGISVKRIAFPIVILGLLGSAFCFYTYDNLIPYSTQKIKELKHYTYNNQFVYMEKYPDNKPKQVIIVTRFDGENILNLNIIKLADKINDETPLISNIYTAQNAIFDGNTWQLKNGKDYKIAPDGIYNEIEDFSSKEILIGEHAKTAYQLLEYSTKRARELDLKTIDYYLNILKKEELVDEYRHLLNKKHQRFAQAFSCILLALTGVILGFSKPREKRILGFTAAAGIVFVYYMIVPFIDLLAQKGVLPPLVAAWIPCSVVAIAFFSILKNKQL